MNLPELFRKYSINEPKPIRWSLVAFLLALLGIVVFGVVTEAHAQEWPEVILQTVSMESANQSDEGMQLVSRVILNRAQQRGQTLEQVVLAPKQFSCHNSKEWRDTWLRLYYGPKTRQRAIKALEMAVSMESKVNHYHTLSVMPYWAKGRVPEIVEGAHVFYTL